MTSDDLKTTQTNTKSKKRNKIVLRAGSSWENDRINDEYLDEFLNNKNS